MRKNGRSKVSLTRDFGDEVVQVDFTAREYVCFSHLQLDLISGGCGHAHAFTL